MQSVLKSFFFDEKIEYFGVLPYLECRETKPHLVSRLGFSPKSVIIYLLPYYAGKCENISLYAGSLDYHIAIEEINARLRKALQSTYPCNNFSGFGDHSPIDERLAAARLGLGIFGKNGLIINQKYGSYIFIADMITDIEISPQEYTPCEVSGCENCGKCQKNCPTGILSGESDVCLSALTQKKGTLSDGERELIRRYGCAWGCDACQSVCPHNQSPKKTPLEFFYRDRIEKLTKEAVLKMSDEEFSRRAFAWRSRATVLRNLEILDKS